MHEQTMLLRRKQVVAMDSFNAKRMWVRVCGPEGGFSCLADVNFFMW